MSAAFSIQNQIWNLSEVFNFWIALACYFKSRNREVQWQNVCLKCYQNMVDWYKIKEKGGTAEIATKRYPKYPIIYWANLLNWPKIWNKLEKALNGCPQSVCLLLLNSTVLPGLVKNQLSQQKKRTLRPLKNVQKVLWWFQRFFAYHQTTERMCPLQVSSLLFLLYLNHGNLLF